MNPTEVEERISTLARDQVARLNEQLSAETGGENPWSSRNTVVILDGGREAEIEVKVKLLPIKSEQSEVIGAV